MKNEKNNEFEITGNPMASFEEKAAEQISELENRLSAIESGFLE